MDNLVLKTEPIYLPDINHYSTLDIVRDTKKMVMDHNKFNSIMRNINLNKPRNIKKEILYLHSAEKMKLKNHFTLNFSKSTAVDEFSDSYLSRQKSNNYIFNKENLFFSNLFYDFLGLTEENEFNYNFKNKFDEFCIKNIDLLKMKLCEYTVFKKHFNSGKKNEINLKLKSFKFI
jgi:hypothetical protein